MPIRLILLAAIAGFSVCSCAREAVISEFQSSNNDSTPNSKTADVTNVGDNTEWRLWYIAKGTRSEGIHGALIIKGQSVVGQSIGEEINTAIGDFSWHGDWNSRTHLFSKSGWLPTDLSSIYPSRKTGKPR